MIREANAISRKFGEIRQEIQDTQEYLRTSRAKSLQWSFVNDSKENRTNGKKVSGVLYGELDCNEANTRKK